MAENDQRERSFWRGREGAAAALVLVAAGLSRLPFFSPVLDSWDACQFALALERYNVALHRPHPPGYPLFVAPAYALFKLGLSGHAALVACSVAWGLGACWAVFALARRIYGRRAGVYALVLAAWAPMLWALSEVGLSYTAEACCSAVVGLLCYRAWRGERAALWWAALALGAAGGVRQNVFLFCLPLFLLSAWRQGAKRAAGALALAGAVLCLALLPAMLSCGDAREYFAASRAQFCYVVWWPSAAREVASARFAQAAANLWENARTLGVALVAEVLALAVGAVPLGLFGFGEGEKGGLRGLAGWFALWFFPGLVFECLFIVGHTGYALFFGPPLWVLAGGGLSYLAARWRVGPWPALLCLAANVAVFFALRPADVARWRALEAKLRYVREHFDPRETVLICAREARHAQYYLREFQGFQLPGWWTAGVDAFWALGDPHGFRHGMEQYRRALVPVEQTTLPALPPLRERLRRRVSVRLPRWANYAVFLDERYLALADTPLREVRLGSGETIAVVDLRRAGRKLTYGLALGYFSRAEASERSPARR